MTKTVERGLDPISLPEGIDSHTATCHRMVDFAVRIAKYQRDLSGDRVAVGMSSARTGGTRVGRPPADSEVIRDKIRTTEDAEACGLTAVNAAPLVGSSRAMLYRPLQEHGSQP